MVFGGGGPGAGPQGFDPGQSSTASSCGVPPQRAMLREPQLAEQLVAVLVSDTVILARGRTALGYERYQCLGPRGVYWWMGDTRDVQWHLPAGFIPALRIVIDVPVVVRHGFVVLSARWFVQFLDEVDIPVIVQRQVWRFVRHFRQDSQH